MHASPSIDPPSGKPKVFRYDINALRALAVISVILYHYKVPGVHGGFSGVDVFFVISGYLMTKICYGSLQTKTFSLVTFYGNRAKRIIPALSALIIVLSLVLFFVFFPEGYSQYLKNAIASLLFYSNILYWKNQHYFDPSSDTNILLHTWSLSVEWQFYLVYPLLILLLHRLFRTGTGFRLVFTVLTLLLAAVAFWFTKTHATASFYLFPFRAWEMMAGGICFLWEGKIRNSNLRVAMALAGYTLILASAVFLSVQMPWPGGFTCIPVLATMLVILAGENSFRFLSWEPVQYVGRISYSLYLWHWPLIVLSQYLGFVHGPVLIIALIACSFLFAHASYTWIERSNFEIRKVLLAGAAGLGTCLILLFGHFNRLVFKPEAVLMSEYYSRHQKPIMKQFDEGRCYISGSLASRDTFHHNFCLQIVPGRENILLMGDSHAGEFSQSFKELFEKSNRHLVQATASGCYPFLRTHGLARCTEMVNSIYKTYLPAQAGKINGVVLICNWCQFDLFDKQAVLTDLRQTLSYLKKLGIPVVVIGQTETYTIPYPVVLGMACQYGDAHADRYSTPVAAECNAFMKHNFNDCYVDIYNASGNSMDFRQDPYMIDQNHLSKAGADAVLQHICKSEQGKRFFRLVSSHFEANAHRYLVQRNPVFESARN